MRRSGIPSRRWTHAGGLLPAGPALGSSAPVVQEPDLRLIGLGSKLLAYFDVRSTVSGGTASMTLSATMQKNIGSTSPAVTIQGSLSTPRDILITYPTGGTLGTMKYIIYLGDSVMSGTSAAAPDNVVDIGGGNTVTFAAGTYGVADSHCTECTGVAELTGLANAALTSVLAGRGPRYEAYGLNGKRPSLKFTNAAFENENGIPALATGTDTVIEVHMLGETWKHISGVGASVPWGFSNQTDTTKSYLRMIACGPTIGSGLNSALAIQRRDSGGSPATQTLICDRYLSDLDPHVTSTVLGASGQIHVNGMLGKAVAASTNRGVATTLNRFGIGNLKLGTAALSSANWWLGRWTALAITQSLTTAERLATWKALIA